MSTTSAMIPGQVIEVDDDQSAKIGAHDHAVADIGGIAAAGPHGQIDIYYRDENGIMRQATGIVGEHGIKAYIFYRVDNGRLVEVD